MWFRGYIELLWSWCWWYFSIVWFCYLLWYTLVCSFQVYPMFLLHRTRICGISHSEVTKEKVLPAKTCNALALSGCWHGGSTQGMLSSSFFSSVAHPLATAGECSSTYRDHWLHWHLHWLHHRVCQPCLSWVCQPCLSWAKLAAALSSSRMSRKCPGKWSWTVFSLPLMFILKTALVVVFNTKSLPLVGEVGLGADLVRIDGSSTCTPGFSRH